VPERYFYEYCIQRQHFAFMFAGPPAPSLSVLGMQYQARRAARALTHYYDSLA
jgi:hypothetical protein